VIRGEREKAVTGFEKETVPAARTLRFRLSLFLLFTLVNLAFRVLG